MFKGKKHTLKSKLKISNSCIGRIPWNKGKHGLQIPWNKGKHLSKQHIKHLHESHLRQCRPHTETTKKKIRNSLLNHVGANKGKHFSKETKRKMRQSAIERIKNNQNGQISPNYNPLACKLIDTYGKVNGYTFQHAENGGEFHIKELGYFVDGYDINKNTVIEYYEKKHRRTIKQDKKRKQEIITHLGCKFIELKEWN